MQVNKARRETMALRDHMELMRSKQTTAYVLNNDSNSNFR